jgi:L-alanine-DL-glutamate epimerase-like enolase superfamily enzyme
LFGIESALLDLNHGGRRIYFENAFARGEQKIPINGLIWMGDEESMHAQIEEKLASGFTTIKMKIGAIGIETELALLKEIRNRYSANEITLRVDANGAFDETSAKEILEKLAALDIHSIEQPILAGQDTAMTRLCRNTPIPIALDEELIGITDRDEKIHVLDHIQPQYIILKPSLHGGISGTKEWIELAEKRHIQWWMTSALESNIGLEVICQLAGEYTNALPQGLGTGSLYTNNIDSRLTVEKGMIFRKLS